MDRTIEPKENLPESDDRSEQTVPTEPPLAGEPTGEPAAAEPARIEAGPVPQAERIASIDVLRGIALLGILVMNIQSFSMPQAAYAMPVAYGNFEGLNYWVWFFCHLFADQKFMTIFSMLFGAGILLSTQRRDRAGMSAGLMHYRRMFWLLFMGMIHAYVLWYGDILVSYALCGMFVFWFRGLGHRVLWFLGSVWILVGALIFLMIALFASFGPAEIKKEMTEGMVPSQESIDEELEAYRSGWSGQQWQRATTTFKFQAVFPFVIFWRVAGLMFVGIALFKTGFLAGEKPASAYVTSMLFCLMIGLSLILVGIWKIEQSGWNPLHYFFYAQFNYWGSIFVSLGYCSAVMLLCRSQAVLKCLYPFAAVGKTALSNYFFQTIAATTVFYGHGFGMFGRLERIQQIQVVAGIWVVQLILSTLWVQRFRFGPFEWVWRMVTHCRVVGLLR